MDARINKPNSPYLICQKTHDWYNLWLDLEQLVIPMVYCWIDNVKLYYDKVTRTTHNTPGVETRIPGWGNPEVVEWIDPTKNSAGAYFKDIANELVKLGYIRKQNIHGAPYDFRKAPSELSLPEWLTNYFHILLLLLPLQMRTNSSSSISSSWWRTPMRPTISRL